MRYCLIKMEVFHSSEYKGAKPRERATWHDLLAFCYEQENGGRISGAHGWNNRKWEQVVGLTLEEIEREADGLWRFDGQDIIVGFYDIEYAEKITGAPIAGRAGGRVSSPAKTEAARRNGLKGGPKTWKSNTQQYPTIPNDPLPNDYPITTQQNLTQQNPSLPKHGKPNTTQASGSQAGSQADRQAAADCNPTTAAAANPLNGVLTDILAMHRAATRNRDGQSIITEWEALCRDRALTMDRLGDLLDELDHEDRWPSGVDALLAAGGPTPLLKGIQ